MLRRIIKRIERFINQRQAYKFLIRDWTSLRDLKACADVVGTMRFSRNLEPLEMPRPRGKRLLVFAPHPDDEVLGPGGTILKSIAAGAEVKVVFVTSGHKHMTTAREAGEVAERYGWQTEFLDLPVGDILSDAEALNKFASAINRFAPDCLFLPFLFDDHDEHRLLSDFLWMAANQGLLGNSAIEIWAYQVYTALIPNVVVDISAEAERKAAAMRAYVSQNRSRDWAHYILGLNAFNTRFTNAQYKPKYLEAFFVLPLKDYVELCAVYFDRNESVYYSSGYSARISGR